MIVEASRKHRGVMKDLNTNVSSRPIVWFLSYPSLSPPNFFRALPSALLPQTDLSPCTPLRLPSPWLLPLARQIASNTHDAKLKSQNVAKDLQKALEEEGRNGERWPERFFA